MVVSKINNQVNYKETKNVFSEDVDAEVSTYEMYIQTFIPNKKITIVFGKPKYENIEKGVIYFPIYLVINDAVVSPIGILEEKKENIPKIMDEENEIDPENINEPIFFDFVKKEFFDEFDNQLKKKQEDIIKKKETKEIKQNNKLRERDDLFDIEPISSKNGVEETKDDIHNIFVDIPNAAIVDVLKEETKKDAEKYKEEYEKHQNNEWIEDFMKNNNYKIIDNEGGGNCFFAVIRDAFNEIGKKTTVEKLRNIVAENFDEDTYNEYQKLYLNITEENDRMKKEIEETKKIMKELKKRQLTIKTKDENDEIMKQVKMINGKNQKNKKMINENDEFLRDNIFFMKNIKSFQEFKNYIRTSNYWADTFAISKLEEFLNVKLIILSEESYNDKAFDSVMNCGELNKNIEKKNNFSPDYYIITSYTGNHYKLITYKNKKIFKYKEIPYDVKMLILKKCMEKNSGIYYLIDDFKELKQNFGLDANEGKPDLIIEDNPYQQDDIYVNDIVFMFHNKSFHAKPGDGSGETIPKPKKIDFLKLSKIKDWRRKLDDDWTNAPFTLDNKRWASVTHYYQGSKFKKGFPDFYHQFSLDSNSDISQEVSLAETAGGKSKNKLRNPNITVDPDFYNERHKNERYTALNAKFTQNLDLKEMLLLTYPAKLNKFIRGSPAEPDLQIMELRKQIIKN